MKKAFYILFALMACSFASAQYEVNSLKINNTPVTVNDTANTELLVRYKAAGTNKGMVRKMTWGYLAGVLAGGISTPTLSSVLTAGNTANNNIILTNEGKFRSENGANYLELNFIDTANLLSNHDTLFFNHKRVITEDEFDEIIADIENLDLQAVGNNGSTLSVPTPIVLSATDNLGFTQSEASFNEDAAQISHLQHRVEVNDDGIKFVEDATKAFTFPTVTTGNYTIATTAITDGIVEQIETTSFDDVLQVNDTVSRSGEFERFFTLQNGTNPDAQIYARNTDDGLTELIVDDDGSTKLRMQNASVAIVNTSDTVLSSLSPEGAAVFGELYQSEYRDDGAYFQNTDATVYGSIQQTNDALAITSNKKIQIGGTATPSIDIPVSGGIPIPFTHGSYTNSLPNGNGTLALLSDIPSTSGFVPYTGATANVNLGSNWLFFNGGYIYQPTGSQIALASADGTSIAAGNSDVSKSIVLSGTHKAINYNYGLGLDSPVNYYIPLTVSVNGGSPVLADDEGNIDLTVSTGGATNLTNTPSPTGIAVNSSSGTGTTLPPATGTNAGLLLPGDYTKLSNTATNPNSTYFPYSGGNITGNTSLASTASNGLMWYNTTDQTTNYERYYARWASNIFTIGTESGGTGINRQIRLAGPSGRAMTFGSATLSGVAEFNVGSGSTTNSSGMGLIGTNSASSGMQNSLSLLQTVNQSGTAGYSAYYASIYEQGTGSGNKYLINVGNNSAANGGGSHTQKFTVTNTGAGTFADQLTIPAGTASTSAVNKSQLDAATGIGSPVTVTTTYTTSTTKTIKANGTFTISLSTTAVPDGFEYVIKNIGSGTVTINVSGGGTIDGVSSKTLNVTNSFMRLIRDGSNYIVVGQ